MSWGSLGEEGPKGPPGNAGSVGATGATGPTGPTGAAGATGGAGATGANGAAAIGGGPWHFGSNTAGVNTSASQWIDTGGCTVPGLANAVRGFVALEACEIYIGGISQTAGTGSGVTFGEVFLDNVATGKGPSIPFASTNLVTAISPVISVAAGVHVAIKPYRSSGTGTSGTNIVISLQTRTPT